MIMNSANNKEVDILRMLTKAKDEYTKVRFAISKISAFVFVKVLMFCQNFLKIGKN